MGVWAAGELSRRADSLHAPVVLLEPGSFEKRAPATALVVSGKPSDGALRPALIDGARALEQFEVSVGRAIGFGRPGVLSLGAGTSSEGELRLPAHALGLDAKGLLPAEWQPLAASFDSSRLHTEVLSLGRTRGLVTRPGVAAESLVFEGGRLVGLETSRGRFKTDTVLISDPVVAARLLPEENFALEFHDRYELRLPSALFETSQQPYGVLRGSVQDFFKAGSQSKPMDVLWGSEEALEYPHPALFSGPLGVFPDALSCELIVTTDQLPDLVKLRKHLADLAPVFQKLGEVSSTRQIPIVTRREGNPVIGQIEEGLFVAFGLGVREAQLAAGLAPGLAALMHGEPVAAFDVDAFAPQPTHRERS